MATSTGHASDQGQLRLKAGSINYDARTGITAYRRQVQLIRGGFQLRAHSAHSQSKDGKIVRIIALGTPAMAMAQATTTTAAITLSANKLTYDPTARVLSAEGAVLARRGHDIIRAHTLIYSLADGRLQIQGNTDAQAHVQIKDTGPNTTESPQ